MGASKRQKKVPQQVTTGRKTVVRPVGSSENQKIAWMFDMVDREGAFAFDPGRADFDAEAVLQKIVEYSSMQWSEIRRQTHDRGKSKHHLLDCESLSREAKERIAVRQFDEETDSIFSFAFDNTMRIIGIRENEKFHVVWFDPKHEFCPSTRT